MESRKPAHTLDLQFDEDDVDDLSGYSPAALEAEAGIVRGEGPFESQSNPRLAQARADMRARRRLLTQASGTIRVTIDGAEHGHELGDIVAMNPDGALRRVRGGDNVVAVVVEVAGADGLCTLALHQETDNRNPTVLSPGDYETWRNSRPQLEEIPAERGPERTPPSHRLHGLGLMLINPVLRTMRNFGRYVTRLDVHVELYHGANRLQILELRRDIDNHELRNSLNANVLIRGVIDLMARELADHIIREIVGPDQLCDDAGWRISEWLAGVSDCPNGVPQLLRIGRDRGIRPEPITFDPRGIADPWTA